MVKDIRGEEDASFYSGLLVSAFAVAEACTAMFWGELSDKYGRKPIILIALAGTALSSLLFGFAKNYWVALFARAVGGLLNGNQAVLQTMVAEMIHKPEHERMCLAKINSLPTNLHNSTGIRYSATHVVPWLNSWFIIGRLHRTAC